MSPTDESDIQALMVEYFPEELEIDSALWTRRAVQELIENLCETRLPIRTVGEYLKTFGELSRAAVGLDPSKTTQAGL